MAFKPSNTQFGVLFPCVIIAAPESGSASGCGPHTMTKVFSICIYFSAASMANEMESTALQETDPRVPDVLRHSSRASKRIISGRLDGSSNGGLPMSTRRLSVVETCCLRRAIREVLRLVSMLGSRTV